MVQELSYLAPLPVGAAALDTACHGLCRGFGWAVVVGTRSRLQFKTGKRGDR